jgi:sec-independent protein translocase protein TatB
MFDLFDPSKIFLVGVVALIVIGPKELPRVMRTVGQVVGRMRKMANEFQQQFNEAMREAELEDVKKELAAMNDAAKVEVTGVDVSFDPATLTQHDNTKALEVEKPAVDEKPIEAPPPHEANLDDVKRELESLSQGAKAEEPVKTPSNGAAPHDDAATPRAEAPPPELAESLSREGRAL